MNNNTFTFCQSIIKDLQLGLEPLPQLRPELKYQRWHRNHTYSYKP